MGERLKTWKKKLTKENMAIMALLGILLMVIAIPVKKTETQKDQTAAPENKSTASGTQETEEEDNTEMCIRDRFTTIQNLFQL